MTAPAPCNPGPDAVIHPQMRWHEPVVETFLYGATEDYPDPGRYGSSADLDPIGLAAVLPQRK